MTSYERHGVSYHRQLHCVFKVCLGVKERRLQNSVLPALCEGNHRWLVEYPYKKASHVETVSMSWRYRLGRHHASWLSFSSPDSKHLLTAGFRTIFIWCTDEGHLLHTLDQHEAPIERIRFAVKGRFLITCGQDQRIILWDYKERKFLADFRAHCPVEVIAVPEDLSNILYAPENIDYLGVLRPNPHIMGMKGDTNYVFEEMPLFRIPDDDDDANPWG